MGRPVNTHPLKGIGFFDCSACGRSGHVAVREATGKQVRFVDADPPVCPLCGTRFNPSKEST